MGKLIHLEPARPVDPEEVRPYLPKVPWKWVGLSASLALLFASYYWITEARKVAALKEELLTFESRELTPVRNRYEQFLRKLENFVLDAESKRPSVWVDPSLTVRALQQSKGLFLRLADERARSKDDIRRHAGTGTEDTFARCIGVQPVGLGTVYADGKFLLDDWKAQVAETSSVMKLRVLRHQLRRALREKLPSVAQHLRAHWLMLALERGSNAGDPLDVYVWDLKKDTLLLSARTTQQGEMRFVRYGGQASQAPKVDPSTGSQVARDCLAASHVAELLGDKPRAMGRP
jgi:hypothetical protein